MFWRFVITLLFADFLVVLIFSFVVGIGILLPFGVALAATEKHPVFKKLLAMPLAIIPGVLQVYFWGGWSAFCVALVHKYTADQASSWHWAYWLIAFASCTSPLAWLTHQEARGAQSSSEIGIIHRGGCLYSVAGMVAFVIFAVWPNCGNFLYDWGLHFLV